MFSRKFNKIMTGLFAMAIGFGSMTMPLSASGISMAQSSESDVNSAGTNAAGSGNSSAGSIDNSTEPSTGTESDLFNGGSVQDDAATGEAAGSDASYSVTSSAAQETSESSVVLPESVSDATKGIVQVNSIYTDEAGKEYIILGCTGFLIGNTEDGEYVITTNSVVAPTKATRDDAFTTIGVTQEEKDWDKINLSVKVVVEGDVSIEAEIITRSPELNIAVVKLSQPLYNRTPLSILTSDDLGSAKPYKATEIVYALGFPYAVRYDRNTVMYDQDDVTMSSGSIANNKTHNDIQVIEHDCLITGNNCGGPLINTSGYVIGINEQQKDGRYYCSVDCAELVRILDALGITYSKVTTSEYESMNSAKDSTVQEVAPPEERSLLEQIPLSIIIICAGIVLVFIVLLIILIVLLLGQKKNPNNDDSKVKESKKEKEEPPRPKPVLSPDYHANETLMLSGGNGNETSVLDTGSSSSMYESYGTLVRKSNNENCVIDKPYFSIGKDSLHVNFCIKDNSSISRQHASIESNNGITSIKDNNSTNGTFVNNVRLIPGQAQIIQNGDLIKLANEEFIYRS